MFVKYLQHFAQFKPADKVLLVLDGASCYLDLSVVDTAMEYEIPQYDPWIIAFREVFEYYWDVELMWYYEENKCRYVKKKRFGEVLTSVW